MPQNSPTIRQQRKWLKNILTQIQDNIADQASIIRVKKQSTKNQKNKEKDMLNHIRNQQNVLREKLRSLMMLERTTKKQKCKQEVGKVKSNFELRMLAKKYREFKQNLQQKNRMIKKQDQEDKIEANRLREQHLKTLCQERRKKIQQTLRQMSVRRKQRQQKLKSQRRKLKSLKKRKLFQKMKQNWNKRTNDMNSQKFESYKKIKKDYSVNISALTQHEKKYDELKVEKQQRRTLRLAESRFLPEIKHYQSRFFNRVVKDEKQRKRKYFDSLIYGKKVKDRQKQYQDRVHEEFSPPLKEREESQEKLDKKFPLDRQEMIKLGNQMYKQGQRVTVTLQRHQQLQRSRLQLLVPQIPKPYPNYLPQFTSKLYKNSGQLTSTKPHSISIPPSPPSQSPSLPKQILKKCYFGQLKKIKCLILDQKMKKLDKLQEIRLIMQKLEYNFMPNQNITQDQLIQRLNAKLEILALLEERGMKNFR